MKKPDPKLIADQLSFLEKLKAAEERLTEANAAVKAARRKLDEFTKSNGDQIAKQQGWERHQAWLAKTSAAVLSDEDRAWLKIKIQEVNDRMEAACGDWWDFMENGKPVDFIKVFEIFHPDIIGPLEFGQLRPTAKMADLAVRVGMFDSLSEARKNGFDKPLTLGEHRFKNGARVLITEFLGE